MSRPVHTITLADDEGMPTLTAECLPYRWNGWYVPVITPEQMRDYFARSAAADRNGTWGTALIETVDDGRTLRLHTCETSFCDPATGHDHDEDWTWPVEDGTAAVDGLVWSLAG